MVALILAYIHLMSLLLSGGQLDKPIQAAMLDIHDECGYILQIQHFSKFAVGGILEQ